MTDGYLSITLTHYNIEHREQCYKVCDLVTNRNFFERGKIDERGGPYMIAPRIWFAVRDNVKRQFTFVRLNSTIRLACRNPNLVHRFLGIDRTLRDLLNCLRKNPQGLSNLVNADEVIIHE